MPLVVAKAVHWGRPGAYGWPAWLRDLAVSSHQDVAFAAAFGLAAACAFVLLRRWPRAQRWAGAAFAALGAAGVLYAVASVQVFAFLRSPLTYALLYMAGDMGSMRSSIGSFVTPGLLAAAVLLPAAYVLLVRRWRLAEGPRARGLAAVLLALAAVWTAWGHRTANGRWSDRSDVLIAKSPHLEILASTATAVVGETVPTIAEAFPAEHLDDFRPAASGRANTSAPRSAAVRNVVVVVMESTGTRYLGLYGSRYATTPHLQAESAHALVYDRFYAHVGFTANALVSLTLSIHPYMTWREYTQEYPAFPGRATADVLRARGYRTAFLTSAYIDYVNMDGFLGHRAYDEVRGWKELGGGELNSWGGTDAVLVDRTLEWIDRDRSRPFYATVWTQQSHHPYDPVPGQPIVDFFGSGPVPPDDYDLGRYLNTVAETDRQIGRLFAGLRARGLEDETLVVVTGDHGEAFGDPHPTWGHGFRLYDEGVRVPLMVWSPALFAGGRRDATIGGHVDVAPTVLDVLGVEAPAEWEGRSLFARERPPRVYFYAANDDYLLGLREGDLKYVHNASRGRDLLFDLARDPDETQDLAAAHPEVCRRLRQRLAAWKQHASGRLSQARVLMARGDGVGVRPRAPLGDAP